MKLTYSIFLFPGLLALYISMTCTLIPDFLRAKLDGEVTHQADHPEDQREKEQLTNIEGEIFQSNKNKPNTLDFWGDSQKWQENTVGLSENSQNLFKQTTFENTPVPTYTRGIYITNSTAQSKKKIQYFITKAHSYQLNTFVIDVQKRMISQEIIQMIKKSRIFPVARVVVAEGGLRQKQFSKQHVYEIIQLIKDSSVQGFAEVQLDYIRYADIDNLLNLSLHYKYNVIRSLLKQAKQVAKQNRIYLSADIFGRITLNQNDHIGQKLEIFGEYTQTIYPMLYPSHYTNDYNRISNPYATVREGIEKSKARLPHQRIVAYIQGFNIKVKPSRLNFVNYIKEQIKACKDSSSDGWVIWNSRNEYLPSFQAIEKYREEQTTVKKQAISKSGL